MKAVVAAFNQEKALVGTFSVIVQIHRWIDLRHYLVVVVAEVLVLEAEDGHHHHQEQPKSFSGQEGVPSSRIRQQQPQEEQKKCKHPMIHL